MMWTCRTYYTLSLEEIVAPARNSGRRSIYSLSKFTPIAAGARNTISRIIRNLPSIRSGRATKKIHAFGTTGKAGSVCRFRTPSLKVLQERTSLNTIRALVALWYWTHCLCTKASRRSTKNCDAQIVVSAVVSHRKDSQKDQHVAMAMKARCPSFAADSAA